MGYPLHLVEGFGTPFLAVHEQMVLIPESGRQETRNEAVKLIFVLDGACRHRVERLPADGSGGGPAEVSLSPGDVMVIPHRCRHAYLSDGGRTEKGAATARRVHALRLAFDPSLVPPLTLPPAPSSVPAFPDQSDPDTDLAAFARAHLRRFRHLPGAQDAPGVRETLAALRDEAQGRPPGYRLRVHGLCAGLTTLIARQMIGAAETDGAAAASGVGGSARHLATLARDYALLHLDQPLTLERIAAHVGVSDAHLARLFRRATGQTVGEYLLAMRLERAKTLLSGSGDHVGEVARRCGFGSLPAFSRAFRRAVGVSPSAYRSRIAGEAR